jgi:hypothetical protein
VERLLDRVDAAIYLLDYTKLKTAEEAQVLERLKAINPGLVGRLSSRLFFAVNKIDQAEQSCGLGEEETREYVADLVTRQLNCPDFRLQPDQVGLGRWEVVLVVTVGFYLCSWGASLTW